MELVDPNVCSSSSSSANADGDQKDGQERKGAPAAAASCSSVNNREGWGTAEATEMITNNLFYITVKVGTTLLPLRGGWWCH